MILESNFLDKHHSMEAALWKVDWILIKISPLFCCLEESLPWLTVWKKGIWDNISVIIHGKLGVWNKKTWLFYLENCCLAHCDWKNVVWNKIASIHGAIVWKNMSGTKYPLVLWSEPGKEILAICLAVCLKNANMSVIASHKYNITSLTPVFHTGRVKPMGGGSRSHEV